MTATQLQPQAIPPRGNLLDLIKVQYGPPGLIGRFLLQGEAEARRRGVSLSLASFEELAEANLKNRATWKPLVSILLLTLLLSWARGLATPPQPRLLRRLPSLLMIPRQMPVLPVSLTQARSPR